MRTDKDIKDDVLAEIEWDPQIASTEVGVSVTGRADRVEQKPASLTIGRC